jgi:hypothetical protein
MPRSSAQPQLAFDETLVEDPTVESALEERLARKVVLDKVRKEYDEASAVVAGEVEKLELPEGRAIRIGRFRITRTSIPAQSVEFERKASSRIRISIAEGEDGTPDNVHQLQIGEKADPHQDAFADQDAAVAAQREASAE